MSVSRHPLRAQLSFLVPSLLILALASLFFWRPLFLQETFFYGAMTRHYYVQKFLVSDQWTNNKIPLWDSSIYTGFPLLAYSPSAAVYPLNLLFLLPLPFHTLVAWYVVFHFLLASGFMYLLARELSLGRVAALSAGIVYGFGGFVLGKGIDLDTLPALAYIPVVLFFATRYANRGNPLYLLGVSLAVGLMLVASHTQMALVSMATIGIFALYMGGSRVRGQGTWPGIRLLLMLAAGVLAGMALAAPQILTTFELAQLSRRAEGLTFDQFTQGSMPPWHLLTLFFPRFFGGPPDEASYLGWVNFRDLYQYAGVLPLILAVFAYRAKEHRRLAWFLYGLVALGLVLALGRYTPLYRLLYEVPLLNSARFPARWFTFTHFALALLAGIGLQGMLFQKGETSAPSSFQGRIKAGSEREPLLDAPGQANLSRFKIPLRAALLLLVGLSWLATLLMAIAPEAAYSGLGHLIGALPLPRMPEFASNLVAGRYPVSTNLVYFSVMLTLSTGWVVLAKMGQGTRGKGQGLLAEGALAIIAVDLLLAGQGVLPVRDASYLRDKTAVIEFLQKDQSLYRIFPANVNRDKADATVHLYNSEFGAMFGISTVTGPNSLGLRRYYDLLWAMEDEAASGKDYRLNARLAGLANTKYVIAADKIDLPGLTEVFRQSGHMVNHQGLPIDYTVYVYRDEDVLPRAFVVHRARVIQEPEKLLDAMTTDAFTPAEEVLLEEPGAPLPSGVASAQGDTVAVMQYEAQRVAIKTRSATPGYLVLSDTFYPGWKAYVDGMESRIWQADYLFRGVYLEPGEHTVEFRYEPGSFRLGVWISGITMVGMGASGLWSIVRHRHSGRASMKGQDL